jgi:hypothetical protein
MKKIPNWNNPKPIIIKAPPVIMFLKESFSLIKLIPKKSKINPIRINKDFSIFTSYAKRRSFNEE